MLVIGYQSSTVQHKYSLSCEQDSRLAKECQEWSNLDDVLQYVPLAVIKGIFYCSESGAVNHNMSI